MSSVPVVLVPSVFFINGTTGVPVEILGGAVATDTIIDKLPAILALGKVTASMYNNN